MFFELNIEHQFYALILLRIIIHIMCSSGINQKIVKNLIQISDLPTNQSFLQARTKSIAHVVRR